MNLPATPAGKLLADEKSMIELSGSCRRRLVEYAKWSSGGSGAGEDARELGTDDVNVGESVRRANALSLSCTLILDTRLLAMAFLVKPCQGEQAN